MTNFLSTPQNAVHFKTKIRIRKNPQPEHPIDSVASGVSTCSSATPRPRAPWNMAHYMAATPAIKKTTGELPEPPVGGRRSAVILYRLAGSVHPLPRNAGVRHGQEGREEASTTSPPA